MDRHPNLSICSIKLINLSEIELINNHLKRPKVDLNAKICRFCKKCDQISKLFHKFYHLKEDGHMMQVLMNLALFGQDYAN